MKWLIRPSEVHLAIPFRHLLSQWVLLLICLATVPLSQQQLKCETKNLFQGIRRNWDLAHVSSPRTSDGKFHKHVLGIWKGISHYKRNLNFNRFLYEMKARNVETQPSPGPTLSDHGSPSSSFPRVYTMFNHCSPPSGFDERKKLLKTSFFPHD